MIKRILIVIIFVVCSVFDLKSAPEFALWTGNKCTTCHLNQQGGGMRNEFGWSFPKDASLFSTEDEPLKAFYNLFDKQSYGYLDKRIAFGTDFRMQTIRSHKTPDAVRRYIPMQMSVYGMINPIDGITFEGQYNFGRIMFPGQTEYSASVLIQPSDDLPILRIGHFQPSFGLRECDMTMLDRRIAAIDATESLIAPDYAEWGAEIIYDAPYWLTTSFGVFDAQNLAKNTLYGNQISLIPLEHNPTFNYKLTIYPNQIFDFLPDGFLGGSYTINGLFWYATAFLGTSITDELQIIGKFAGSNMPHTRTTENYTISANYLLQKGVFLGARAEFGNTTLIYGDEKFPIINKQYVLYSRIFLMPYLELIPEYRILETEEYRSSRWAVQLHIYY